MDYLFQPLGTVFESLRFSQRKLHKLICAERYLVQYESNCLRKITVQYHHYIRQKFTNNQNDQNKSKNQRDEELTVHINNSKLVNIEESDSTFRLLLLKQAEEKVKKLICNQILFAIAFLFAREENWEIKIDLKGLRV